MPCTSQVKTALSIVPI